MIFKYFVIIFLIVFACSAPKNEEADTELNTSAKMVSYRDTIKKFEYSFLFGEVHDRAVVYVNGKEVFETTTNGKTESVTFGLDDYLTSGKNLVKVELYNDQTVMGKDTSWEIYYELFNRKEPIDFMHEHTTAGNLGLVFETTHEIHF